MSIREKLATLQSVAVVQVTTKNYFNAGPNYIVYC